MSLPGSVSWSAIFETTAFALYKNKCCDPIGALSFGVFRQKRHFLGNNSAKFFVQIITLFQGF
jgi:hypothetical protein